jgi:hypothetical protein
MIAILLVGVCVTIYYIFMYDTWYPNDGTEHGNENSSLGSEGGTHDDPYKRTDS